MHNPRSSWHRASIHAALWFGVPGTTTTFRPHATFGESASAQVDRSAVASDSIENSLGLPTIVASDTEPSSCFDEHRTLRCALHRDLNESVDRPIDEFERVDAQPRLIPNARSERRTLNDLVWRGGSELPLGYATAASEMGPVSPQSESMPHGPSG